MKGEIFSRAVIKKDAVLNPVERISEVLFGLIMVLTFTGGLLLIIITIALRG